MTTAADPTDLPARYRRVPRALTREPAMPQVSTPFGWIWWLIRQQPWRMLLGTVVAFLSLGGRLLPPYLSKLVIDDGIIPGNLSLTLWLSAATLAAAWAVTIAGIVRHRIMTRVRTDARTRALRVLVRHSNRVGAALPRRLGSGEMTSIQSVDLDAIGGAITAFGPGVGGLLAYIATAWLLFTISVPIAWLVLLGTLLVASITFPMARTLVRISSEYRHEQGQLSNRGADIVTGLRVLTGIGGKERFAAEYRRRSQSLRRRGYQVAQQESWVTSIGDGSPAVLVAVVVAACGWVAMHGGMTVGEMSAVVGYTTTLLLPMVFMFGSVKWLTQGLVAARRFVRFLDVTPDVVDHGTTPPPAAPATLVDVETGFRCSPGLLHGVACADPAAAQALMERLTRFVDAPVTWGDVPLREVPLAAVRARLVLADADAYLFAGTLREMLSSFRSDGTMPTDAELHAALHAACATDVVDALPHGLDSAMEDRAGNVSGGQRQRLRLARAVALAPEALFLVTPTSAVDATTEASMATGLAEFRRGLTTVVVTTSPLVLAHCDTVTILDDGAAMTSTHDELLDDPTYRRVVLRDVEPEERPTSGASQGEPQ